MLKKKISLFCFAAVMTIVLAAGCGRKDVSELGGSSSEAAKTETAAVRMEKPMTQEHTDKETVMEENMDRSGTETKEEDAAGQGKRVEAFAEKIQEAVADRDLQALGDLLFYPCFFITGDAETITLNSLEDLIKQNPDMVFGDDLMVAVANVDTVSLKIKTEGVIMGDGASKIIFQERSDGSMGITEIRE